MDPIKQHRIAGYTARLFANRIEEERKSFLGKQTSTILLKSITNVSCGVGRLLEVVTIDGKKHRLNIAGKTAEEWRAIILENI